MVCRRGCHHANLVSEFAGETKGNKFPQFRVGFRHTLRLEIRWNKEVRCKLTEENT